MAFNAPYVSAQPVNDFGLTTSKIKFSATLALGSEQTITVPGDSPRYKAIFRVEPGPNREVWYALNETAEVPAGSTFVSTTSELIPVCREVKAGDVLHFISDLADVQVSVVFYSLNTNN